MKLVQEILVIIFGLGFQNANTIAKFTGFEIVLAD